MIIYVGYVSSDYAHALWMSTSKMTIEKEIAEYKKRGGRCPTWITKYNVTNKLTDLDCD